MLPVGVFFRYGAVLMDSQHPDGSVGYTVLHNSTCQHAGPIYINVMHSALLRLASGNKNMTIQTRNHPLPPTKSQRLQRHVCLCISSSSNFLWYQFYYFIEPHVQFSDTLKVIGIPPSNVRH